MKHLKNLRIIVIIGSILTMLGATGCGLLPKEDSMLAPPLVKPKQEDYNLSKVKKGDIALVVKGIGTMVPLIQTPLYIKEGGHRLKSINVESGQIVKIGTVVAEMDAGNLPNQIKIQQFQLKIAEDDLKMVKDAIVVPDSLNTHKTTATELDKAQLGVYKEQEALNQMEQELAATKVTATISGQVIFVGDIKEGDIVNAYDPIVTVADINKLQISFDTTDSAKVKLGMVVNVNNNGSKYTGVVTMLPNPANKNADNKNSILITLNTEIPNCKLGGSVDIGITVQSKQNTLVVPKAAVQSFVGTYVVEVMDGAKKTDMNVEVGIQTPTDVEILSGLKEGQMIILK